jgi:hypothetical protein
MIHGNAIKGMREKEREPEDRGDNENRTNNNK